MRCLKRVRDSGLRGVAHRLRRDAVTSTLDLRIVPPVVPPGPIGSPHGYKQHRHFYQLFQSGAGGGDSNPHDVAIEGF